eukprot:3315814-Amphidinium_carterae.1
MGGTCFSLDSWPLAHSTEAGQTRQSFAMDRRCLSLEPAQWKSCAAAQSLVHVRDSDTCLPSAQWKSCAAAQSPVHVRDSDTHLPPPSSAESIAENGHYVTAQSPVHVRDSETHLPPPSSAEDASPSIAENGHWVTAQSLVHVHVKDSDTHLPSPSSAENGMPPSPSSAVRKRPDTLPPPSSAVESREEVRADHCGESETRLQAASTQYWKRAKEMAITTPSSVEVKGLLQCSSEVMEAAEGSLATACKALRNAWELSEGNHLEGVLQQQWDNTLPSPLLHYLRQVAQTGVDAKYKGPQMNLSAKPHASAAGVQELAWANALEDAAKGRVLLVTRGCKGSEWVIPSPQGAVEKQNPDRTMSGEYRFINDLRTVNNHCAKNDSPPAKQCTHKQLARLVAWWKARLPQVKILMCKKDVSAAFKLIWLKEDACRVMAVQLLGKQWNLDTDVYAVYLVLTLNLAGLGLRANGSPGAGQSSCTTKPTSLPSQSGMTTSLSARSS